jgi:hypothetical protein
MSFIIVPSEVLVLELGPSFRRRKRTRMAINRGLAFSMV